MKEEDNEGTKGERGAKYETNKRVNKPISVRVREGAREGDWHYVMTGQGQATSEIGQRLTPRPVYRPKF